MAQVEAKSGSEIETGLEEDGREKSVRELLSDVGSTSLAQSTISSTSNHATDVTNGVASAKHATANVLED